MAYGTGYYGDGMPAGGGAFTDFIDLQTAVVEHVGTSEIVDVFPRLVRMAETQFNNSLRCREQVTTATLAVASGTATLPVDFVEAIGLYDESGYEYVQQPLQSTRVSQLHRHYYSIGATTLNTKLADGNYTLQYYAAIPTITDSSTDSNWLLVKHPGVYLYGVGFEAAKYLKNIELAQATRELLDMEMRQVSARDERERFSRARVRVQGVTP